ncbi:translesion DNA synthesis-associated protein ImuA [Bordetella bronchialis]|uniref:Cell division protein n=1 Tax=Bordetella bronchialis TaxID=463025 RepID=A0A193FVL5_9BORD|nr:translesion DNA synthesis-associated protein ImuA [Bordetella bronchialis]ANN71680.1 cell division protein [Bordetella bronchialis]
MPTLAAPSPEQIHPALWRGTQLAQAARAAVPTGHAALGRELPGGGWPTGVLNELLLPHPGLGELRLLQPALRALDREGSIVLVQPPFVPHIAAWRSGGLDPARLLWVNPGRPADALWAAEQVLKNGSCAALLCWLPQARPEALRRLHLAAQAGATLFFCLRPARAAAQASPAPLRLALAPAGDGLRVDIVKRRGPVCSHSLYIALERPRTAAREIPPLPARTETHQAAPQAIAPAEPPETFQPIPQETSRTDRQETLPFFDDHATLDRHLPAEAGA